MVSDTSHPRLAAKRKAFILIVRVLVLSLRAAQSGRITLFPFDSAEMASSGGSKRGVPPNINPYQKAPQKNCNVFCATWTYVYEFCCWKSEQKASRLIDWEYVLKCLPRIE